MLDTAISILAAVALLMPGFIVVELSVARSARSSRSDLELALRALTYTLIVHLAFVFWTAHLVKTIGPPSNWVNHVSALSAYVTVVLLGVPIAVGSSINRYIAVVEARDVPPSLFSAALGAGEARDAFDYAFQLWRKEGVWVVVELVGHTPEAPRLIGGVYGRHSAVGQTPQPHDLYLEALCTVDEDENGIRSIAQRVEPRQGIYIPSGQIARIDLIPGQLGTLNA
jgi:Family of unknown function (DUF6338)